MTISNIASELKVSESENTSLLSPIFKELIKNLWENSMRSDAFSENANLAYSSFIAFSNVILNSAHDILPLLGQVFEMLLKTFKDTIDGKFLMQTHSNEFQGYICMALNPTCVKLGNKIDQFTVRVIIDFLIQSFQMRKSVYDEALQVIDCITYKNSEDLCRLPSCFGQ